MGDENPVDLVRAAGFDSETEANILGGNIARLLNLEA
jgi:hypothetical protein